MYNLMILLTVIFTIILIVGLIKPSNVIQWGYYEDKTRTKVLKYFGTSLLICLVLLGVIQNMAINSAQKEVQAKKVAPEQKQAKSTNTGYNPTTEEKKILSKNYESLTYDEEQVLEKLENKYDSMSETLKVSIKADIGRLRKEKTAHSEEIKKLQEQNKLTYANLIKEIEKDYPSMKVGSISGKSEDKSIDIDMKLLHNITATEEQACTLTVMKETKMKEAGIKDILIFIKDTNNKDHGILAFELTNGEYKPSLNTVK